jgi:hypothetical protein
VDHVDVDRAGEAVSIFEEQVYLYGITIETVDYRTRDFANEAVAKRAGCACDSGKYICFRAVSRDFGGGCRSQAGKPSGVVWMVVGEDDQADALGGDAERVEPGNDGAQAASGSGVHQHHVVAFGDHSDPSADRPDLVDPLCDLDGASEFQAAISRMVAGCRLRSDLPAVKGTGKRRR